MTTLSLEQLQSQNRELSRLLKDRAIIAHAQARKLSHAQGDVPEHRGDFDNCPAPSCVEVRFALGREEVAHD